MKLNQKYDQYDAKAIQAKAETIITDLEYDLKRAQSPKRKRQIIWNLELWTSIALRMKENIDMLDLTEHPLG